MPLRDTFSSSPATWYVNERAISAMETVRGVRRMTRLADLARVAWHEKDIASGKANHVPDAICGLTSSDERTRNRSYWRLDNEVVLQSDLYEAAYFVIPFLVQILNVQPDHGRDLIYDLLYEIANGFARRQSRVR